MLNFSCTVYIKWQLLVFVDFIFFEPFITKTSKYAYKMMKYEPRHNKSNKVTVRPAKTQISLGIRPVWSEASLSAWRKLGSLATHWVHSEDSDETGRMPRLIWVFAGRTFILLDLSCRGSPQSFLLIIWAAPSEFGTYRICEQRRFRRACASAQSRQNLRCSLMQAVSQEEPSDRKPDPWPLWMAGHAQLKFVMTECSKTQIRLAGLIYYFSQNFIYKLFILYKRKLNRDKRRLLFNNK